jgi:2-polyprenyl-3-methyl-5-hydroxy-6-metoxy-1,4-benzoquinol methylase
VITDLHDERLAIVHRLIADSGAQTVLDLGCGEGQLLQRLAADDRFEKIVGVDACGMSALAAQQELAQRCLPRRGNVSVIVGSYTDPQLQLHGFDACAMVETIEHIAPEALGNVERAVLGCFRPKMLVMTTPNAEYNPLFGIGPQELRTADHRFEWNRSKFARWVSGVAKRNGYTVRLHGVGEPDPLLGSPTQLALFARTS